MGGVIFGVSSVIPVLYRHGYWRTLCGAEKAEECRLSNSHVDCCEEQLVRLSAVISACFFLCDFSAAPWGEIADRLGARVCLLGAVTLSVFGMLLLGLSASDPSGGSDLLTTSGLISIAVAGPGVFNGGYVGSLALIGDDPLLKAVLAGCSAAVFDGSALVFMLLQLAEGSLGGDFSSPTFSWSILCACVGGGYWAYLRAQNSKDDELNTVPEDTPVPQTKPWSNGEADGSGGVLNDDEASAECDGDEAKARQSGEDLLARDKRTIGQTLLARSNLLMVYFMAVYNLISNFYIETQLDEFELRFGRDTAVWISTTFNLAFPIGGFCTALPASIIMRKYGEQPHIYWSIVIILGAGFATLSLIPLVWSQLTAALIFGPARCLQWACYFQFLADERRYPSELTGRALGYNNVAIGIVGDVMPSMLTWLSTLDWAGDKGARYLSLKVVTLVLLAFASSFSALLFRERHAHTVNPVVRAQPEDRLSFL